MEIRAAEETGAAMKHWAIIVALCRAALATQSPAARQQVARLRDALVKDNDAGRASLLEMFLDAPRIERNPMTHGDET